MFTKNIILAAALVGQAYGLTINTPASLVQCQPASISFSEGTAPYILAVIPGGQVSAAAIETLSSDLTTAPYTWNVNLASGTSITLKLTDSTGTIAYSSPLTIQAGSSNACLNSTAATSGVSTGAVTTTVSGASASATASAVSSAVSTTSTTSLSSSAASAASSASASRAASSGVSAASSGAASATGAVGSAVNSATSAAASATASARSGALANKAVALPAVALAVVGGLAMLL